MQRREALKALGGGLLGAGLPAAPAVAAAQARGWDDERYYKLGNLDLRTVSAIDSHTHPPGERSYSEYLATYAEDFARKALPAEPFKDRDALVARMRPSYEALFGSSPLQTGLRNYVARAYGVPATDASVEAAMKRKMGTDFSAYFRSKMDQENIQKIVLQSGETNPVRPKTLVPDDRFVWTFSSGDFIQPDWAQERGLTEIEDYKAAVVKVLDDCRAAGCVGIKLPVAYFRPLHFRRVDRATAQAALNRVLAARPVARRDRSQNAIYAEREVTEALWAYQDYLYHAVFVRAGELGMNIIIHSAVAMSTQLRSEFNDPTPLYDTFVDVDVQRAGTKFVIIHAGYPHHRQVAAFISQFPNVYTDISFYSHYAGISEDLLRTFLGLGGGGKVMHGSDWTAPEALGYSVDTTRRLLARILTDYRTYYGWSHADCELAARSVLGDTARRVFGIKA